MELAVWYCNSLACFFGGPSVMHDLRLWHSTRDILCDFGTSSSRLFIECENIKYALTDIHCDDLFVFLSFSARKTVYHIFEEKIIINISIPHVLVIVKTQHFCNAFLNMRWDRRRTPRTLYRKQISIFSPTADASIFSSSEAASWTTAASMHQNFIVN